MNVIASLKHTHKHNEHIVFWSPNRCGYTPVLGCAGLYDEVESKGLNDGLDCIAIPLAAAEALSSPTPFYKPGAQFYDLAGPVADNTRANWNRLIAASFDPAGLAYKPKPEVFRGKRRCLPIFEADCA